MPIYEYRCENCEDQFEILQSISDEPLKKCQKCGKHSLEKILGCVLGFVKGRINTIGQLAESNTKKLGRYEREKVIPPMTQAEKDQKDAKERAKKLANASKEVKEKYIHTGEL